MWLYTLHYIAMLQSLTQDVTAVGLIISYSADVAILLCSIIIVTSFICMCTYVCGSTSFILQEILAIYSRHRMQL